MNQNQTTTNAAHIRAGVENWASAVRNQDLGAIFAYHAPQRERNYGTQLSHEHAAEKSAAEKPQGGARSITTGKNCPNHPL